MQEQENKFTADLTPADLSQAYQNLNINEVAKDIHQTNVDNGFWVKPNVIKEKLKNGTPLTPEEVEYVFIAFEAQRLMLSVSELSEAMEALRKGRHTKATPKVDGFFALGFTEQDMPSQYAEYFEAEMKDTFEDELADTVIRIYDHAEANGIDLAKHIDRKNRYNKTRSQMHGGKKF